MAVAVTCTHCGVRLRFKSEHAGKETTCRSCEKPIVVTGETIPDHDVFISYSAKDKPTADAVCAALEAKRIRCWIAPRDILPGKQWAGAILDAISDARVMVLIYSANSNASPQVIREVDRAVSRSVIIIPFRIDATVMCKEMEYYISAAHWLDALSGPMENHIATLVGTARRLLADKSSPVVQQPLFAPKPTAPASRPKRHWVIPIAIVLAAIVIMNGVLLWRQWNPRQTAGNVSSASTALAAPATAPIAMVRPADRPIQTASAIPPAAPAPPHVASPHQHPQDVQPQPIDLLALIDPAKNAVSGKWQRVPDGGMVCEKSPEACIEIPYIPPAEYDFSVRFILIDGTSGFALVPAATGHQFAWMVADENNSVCGFSKADGKDSDANITTRRRGVWIELGTVHTSTVKVRRNAVDGYLDGQLISHFPTDYSNLTRQDEGESFQRGDTIGFGIHNGTVRVLSAEVVEITGQGQWIGNRGAISKSAGESGPAAPSPATSQAQPQHIDLLKLFDQRNDVIRGKWTADGNGLSCVAGGRIQFPYTPPAEYNYRIRFSVSSGNQCVEPICYAAGRQFSWCVGGWGNHICGFRFVDGHNANDNSSTKKAASWFGQGAHQEILVKVRKDGVEGSLNGVPISRLQTDFQNLTIGDAQQLKRLDNIGIWISGDTTTIESAEIEEVSGTGKVLRPPLAEAAPVPKVDAATQPTANSQTQPQTVDLLKLVDPVRDSFTGTWNVRPGVLATGERNIIKRIRVPYHPPLEYDYLVDFTFIAQGGFGDIDQICPDGDHGFVWFMGGWENTVCGIGNIRGKDANGNETSSTKDAVFQPNSQHVSVVQVRRDSVRVILDGQQVAYAARNASDFDLHTGWTTGYNTLGLATFDRLQIHRLELTEIGAAGKPIGRLNPDRVGITTATWPSAVGKTSSLADMIPRAVSVGSDAWLKNAMPNNELVIVDGKKCDHFIPATTTSSLVYDIPSGAMGFQATAVCTTGKKTFRCEILVDGNEALISGLLKDTGSEIPVALPLPDGAHEIELQLISYSGANIDAAWANPEFVFPAAKSP